MIIIFILIITKMIKIILHKYRQLTKSFLKARLSNHFRGHLKSSLRKVSSQLKLETLHKKPYNRNSAKNTRTQSGSLSIDKYTSWQFPLISVIKPTPSTKMPHILQGQSLEYLFFLSDLNKANDGKFLYLVGSVLQSWAAL